MATGTNCDALLEVFAVGREGVYVVGVGAPDGASCCAGWGVLSPSNAHDLLAMRRSVPTCSPL